MLTHCWVSNSKLHNSWPPWHIGPIGQESADWFLLVAARQCQGMKLQANSARRHDMQLFTLHICFNLSLPLASFHHIFPQSLSLALALSFSLCLSSSSSSSSDYSSSCLAAPLRTAFCVSQHHCAHIWNHKISPARHLPPSNLQTAASDQTKAAATKSICRLGGGGGQKMQIAIFNPPPTARV